METLSTPQKELLCPAPPSGVVSDSLSLQSSYREYPAHRPFISMYHHHTPHQTHTHLTTSRLSSPSKAFPETNSAAILSALRNLQEKIRRLELEEGRARLNLHMTGGGDTSHTVTPRQSEKVTRRLSAPTQGDTGTETTYHSSCNQALITQLAAAESRCVQLERQLEHMRRMVRHAKADRTSLGLLKQQVCARSSEPLLDAVSEQVQMEKLERLEQEYLRLTRTQSVAERKICEIEMKLQEEEHQRKLVQDKAKQLQTGLEANRILLQSVSPRLPRKRSKEKRPVSKKSLQQSPHTQPHYRLSLGDVPFVTGTSVGCSHSVRANVQSVLSLLKQHQPQLCNSRVLSHRRTDARSQSDGSSSSSSSSGAGGGGCGEELSELLHGLQEELRLMSIEQDELTRQVETSVSEQERKEIHRDQEMLLLKMERKGEQINKLYRHKTQMKKLHREASGNRRPGGERGEVRVTTTVVATRGRSSAGAVKAVAPPGERSKKNLTLLRDMRALQSSLRT